MIRTLDRCAARRSANSRRARISLSSGRRAPGDEGSGACARRPPHLRYGNLGRGGLRPSAYISPTLAAIPATGRMCCFCQIMASASLRSPTGLMPTPTWRSGMPLSRSTGMGCWAPSASLATNAALETAYRTAGAMYEAGSIEPGRELLAMNFLLDRDAEAWSRELERLKAESGSCDTTAKLEVTGMLSGEFTWRCTHGRISGSLLLAPTHPPLIQAWRLSRITL